jgi:hypothetical protein
MKSIAIFLLITGGLLILGGLVLLVADKVPWLGNLPGDIHYRGRNFSFHFPLMTCILLSIILTVVINIILRFFGR